MTHLSLAAQQVEAVRPEGGGEAPHLPAPHPDQQQRSNVEAVREEEGGDGWRSDGGLEEVLEGGGEGGDEDRRPQEQEDDGSEKEPATDIG